MKIIISLFLTLLLSVNVNAQSKRGNVWVTGTSGNTINFNGSGIITQTGVYFPFKYFASGCSNICDTNGNLLLASDGMNIYDFNGNYIQDGDSIVPPYHYAQKNGFSIYSQSSIFLPLDSNRFYFVTPAFSDAKYQDCQTVGSCYFDLLLYNLVDMNANGGSGQVVKRMVPLMQNARLRKTQMQACRHGNGKDWWLLKNEGDSANVHVFLFTQDSVYDKGVQVFSEPVWGNWDIQGQSAFNSDGSMFATTSHGNSTGLVFISEFDRCYGILSNPNVIQIPLNSEHNPNDTSMKERLSMGLCFSPNGRFLYITSAANIYQYDLLEDSLRYIHGLDTTYLPFTSYTNAYLAPDQKIYIGNYHGTSKQMSRIDNPDVKGIGCNFCPRCLRMDTVANIVSVGTPPCMPDYGLGAKTCWPLSQSESEVRSVEWVVYPNPSSTVFIVQNKQGKKKELYNVQGELLFTTNEDVIDVKPLARGMYYLQVEGQVKKVIIE